MPLIFHFQELAASSDTHTVVCKALVGKIVGTEKVSVRRLMIGWVGLFG